MKRFIIPSLLLFCSISASAQYTIYPVPQKMTAVSDKASFTNDVCVVCTKDIDLATRNRVQQVLEEHGLTVNFTGEAPTGHSAVYLSTDSSKGVSGKFDAHQLILTNTNGAASVIIVGQHSDAVFMGLASLEQMLDASGTTDLPCVTIDDYADQQQRGLVEGYYGYPYSIDVKKDLMRFMMRHKMNSYMYGAKSEPYHHSKWRQAYPTTITELEKKNGYLTQDMVREICETSAATKVNFIWSIHPGNDFLGSDNAITDIMAKYEMMYGLGVRQFGLFVDDVSIPSSQADMEKNATRVTQLQQAINDKWNTADATPESRVKPLNFVPQIYCRSFASSDEQYRNFFTALSKTPNEVIVYTTGGGVWSVPNAADFNQPKQYLGRDVAWWWNYPCNDNADSRIYPMDMYQNFVDMTAVNGSARMDANLNVGIGIVANPMQQGEVAKIPLFSVADYAWNASGFDNKASWEASFPAFLNTSEKVNALKALAPYLTFNDPQGMLPANSPEATKDNISALLSNIDTVKGFAKSTEDSDVLLWEDLRPWVSKLEQMLRSGQKLIDAANTDEQRDERWSLYTDGAQRYEDSNTNEDFIAYTLEGMNATQGSPHLVQPSEKYFGSYLASLHRSAVKDLIPARSRYAAAYTNTSAPLRAISNAQQAYITMDETQLKPGDYVGIALPAPTRISSFLMASSVTSRFAVVTSADGRNWTSLPTGNTGTYNIRDYVKYVKIQNTSNENRSLALSSSVFNMNLYAEPTLQNISAPVDRDYNNRANISDADVSSFWSPYQNQANGDVIRLNYSAAAPVKSVRFVIHTTNNDYMNRGRIEVGTSPSGTFTALKKRGTNITSFTLADMTPLHADGTPYAENESTSGASIYEIVMDGAGLVGQYVRFYNEQARTSNWIRVAEFTTEFNTEASPCAEYPAVCDGLAHTAALVPAGTTITFDPYTAYPVESVEVFTDRGILPARANTDGTITISYDEPTLIYEVVARTQEPVGGVFSATTDKAQYYGLKFQNGDIYVSEGSDADAFLITTADLTTSWAFVGSDTGFKMLSSTGLYVGVKSSAGTDYCYTLTNEQQAAEFIFINDNGTTFEIARAGENSGAFNPWGGNRTGMKIGFWTAGSANNKLVLVNVEQPAAPPTSAATLPLSTGVYEIRNAVTPEDRGYLVDYSQYEAGPSLAECNLNGHQSKHPASRNSSETSSYWYIYNDADRYYIVSLSALQTDDVPRFLKPGGQYNELTKFVYAPEPIVLSAHPTYTYQVGSTLYPYTLISDADTPNVFLSGACGTRSTAGAVRADSNTSDGGAPWRFLPTTLELTAEQRAIVSRAVTLIEGTATVGSVTLVIDKAKSGKATVDQVEAVSNIVLRR